MVGENSTGKSSFLAIISLLSDTEFLAHGQFKNSYVDLGPFDEIITKSSRSSGNINIGIIKESGKSAFDSSMVLDGLLLSFNSKSGFTNLCEVILVNKNSAIRFQYQDDQIVYSLKKIRTDKKCLDSEFCDWTLNNNFDNDIIDEGILKEKDGIVLDMFKRFLMGSLFLLSNIVEEKKKNLYNDFGLDKLSHKLTPSILKYTFCMAPIRTVPKRIYEPEIKNFSVDGTHIPSILRDIYLHKENINYKKIINGLESFGKNSGLFDKISIDPYLENTELSPFELNIELFKKKLKISNVGYGVSQILPILTEILIRDEKSVFLIQQPEIHLHPKSQAFFGEFIYNQFIEFKKNFFIETHSDFIIDRVRLNIRKSKISQIHNKINVLFFENTSKGISTTRLPLNKSGDYSQNQPKTFREFFLREELNFLGLK